MCFLGSLWLELRTPLEHHNPHLPGGAEHVLIKLSQVKRSLSLRKLKNANLGEGECGSHTCSDEFQGLARTLALYLMSENMYVGHSARRSLVTLANHVEEVPSLWFWLLHFLWDSSNLLSHSASDIQGQLDVTIPTISSRKHDFHNKWKQVMGALEVLHYSLRSYKEQEATMLKAFFTISESHIVDIMSSFIAHFFETHTDTMNVGDADDLALGALLRLICSMIHSLTKYKETVETAEITIDGHQIWTSVENFISAFSCYCLANRGHCCISQYLHHKFLMLMFRLHKWFTQRPSFALSCLKILNLHRHTLFGSLFELHPQVTHPLLESPFAHCVTGRMDEQNDISQHRQSQKHATFLLFKAMLYLRKSTCEPECSGLTGAHNLFSAAEQWILDLIAVKIDRIEHIHFSPLCMANNFATCFLQIFSDEDVLLLEMLLLLHEFSKFWTSVHLNATEEAVVLASMLLKEIFQPLRMFIAFLSMVCYDHSVILDYLIMEDVSILCLQYLMGCLRLIVQTWPEFLSFLQDNEKLWEQQEGRHIVAALDIEEAAACLLCLEAAIQRLHGKHAFPYNPSPLLNRLHTFRELWLNRENGHH